MKLFNLKLARDYIEGNDIEGYTLEELENDKDFMMLVMKITHDKKMYSFCSDEVKKNYKFIRFIINTFRDDLDFLCSVVDYFLEKNNDAINVLEVLITMVELTEKKDDELISKYKFVLAAKYRYKMEELKMFKAIYSKENNKELNIGMGFYIIYDDYVGHKEVLDFFAKRLLNDIFVENNVALIKLIHTRFKSGEELEKYGIKKIIIDFVEKYDDMLADYLRTNPTLMKDVEKEIENIKIKFESYEERLDLEKANSILDQVEKYVDSRKGKTILDTTFYLCYAAKKLGIFNTFFKKYFLDKQFSMDTAQELLDSIDEKKLSEILNQSLIDRSTLNSIIRIFKQTMAVKTTYDLNRLEDEYLIHDKAEIIDIGRKK